MGARALARSALAAAALLAAAAATGAHALMPRQQAPAYKATAVIGEKFVKVDSESLKGSWQVLFFYPVRCAPPCCSARERRKRTLRSAALC